MPENRGTYSLCVVITLSAAVLMSAAPASARVAHTVQPGETLWSIAAANNFTTRALAAANGVSETSNVVLGQTIWIPTEAEAAYALQTGGAPAPGPAAATSAPVPTPMGAYTVAAGDTLTAIAARSGVSTEQVAYMNGLDPSGILVAGTALKLPTGSPLAGTSSAPPTSSPDVAPHPTNEFVAPATVEQVAVDHGVSPSLAAAIAKQESGFNNGLTSSANARGVMQLLPGTWDFVRDNLASEPLNPWSAHDNVHAGVMYLQQLLRDTGGDEATATAAYYQGLRSVQSSGLLPETERYVEDVMALRAQFGG
ncbi:MAG TPA: LysM peptidoglycan-binding domain-containing protein [Thermoleophilaceae bacterium]|jgi:LysM repeat protein